MRKLVTTKTIRYWTLLFDDVETQGLYHSKREAENQAHFETEFRGGICEAVPIYKTSYREI